MNEEFNNLLCEKCKNAFFAEANKEICERCAENMFEKVKEYIEENPSNTINQIISETGVEGKYIKKWIREGRLILNTPEGQREKEKADNFKKQAGKLLEEEKEKTSGHDKQDDKKDDRDRPSDGGYYTR
ncbi:hypothetical protein [Natranaerofaba carboxydovora]|uniref:hypothetical protein n=1 Tax=Natranaerofaba carboxydovora TaxID=2742683 RepID=UPI001F1344EB|nr:hypothetical protein [Natranaerofaba carboxydovora]UMZ74633.1 YvyF: flagellar operon protein [Natranaerofaba carboxydovora]